MRELWTLRPVMKDPLPGLRSGFVNVKLATRTFSPPPSDRTLLGTPKLAIASLKQLYTVSARLLLAHFR